jgi:anti-anti-sigma factor
LNAKFGIFGKIPAMSFKIEVRNDVLFVHVLAERLDTQSAPELKGIFTFEQKKGLNKMLLNLEKTKFCDSSGLSAILVGNRLCKDTNGTFAISNIQPMVLKMIEIAQLSSVLNIYSTMDEALKDFE